MMTMMINVCYNVLAALLLPGVSVSSLSSASITRILPVRPTAAAVTQLRAATSYDDGYFDFDESYMKTKQAAVPPVQVVDEMPQPLDGEILTNKYYLLRHGQSTANVAQIISSDRFALAYSDQHGLTETGYQQGRESPQQLLDILARTSQPGDTIKFVSSPFARARQTAVACMDALVQNESLQKRISDMAIKIEPEIVLNDLLVERYFGRLDKQAIYTYAYVWPLDKFNVTHTAFDVESVAAVCTRLYNLIQQLEEKESPSDDTTTTTHIVLVSHADVLQIAQLYASGANNVGDFSSFRFKNGEVREMVIGSTRSLPDPAPLEKPERGTRKG